MEFSSDIGAVQRRMAQTQEGVGRRKATFEALNLSAGQHILDLGCGGGHLLKDLALSVGVERSSQLRSGGICAQHHTARCVVDGGAPSDQYRSTTPCSTER